MQGAPGETCLSNVTCFFTAYGERPKKCFKIPVLSLRLVLRLTVPGRERPRPHSFRLVGATALGSGLALRLRPPPHAAGGWGGLAVLRQRLPNASCCCRCAASLAVAASCTLARV